MNCILFCQNNYAYSILAPIRTVLIKKNYKYIWFVADKIKKDFPYKNENHTHFVSDLKTYRADAIFVPGNAVPHYLRGLKVQIFHGLAGEKKGHFRIRHYFDLYLTQGPYFTKKFEALKLKYKNFDVIETGWSKLDIYGKNKTKYSVFKAKLLETNDAKKIILYAPTFSPKLTSAPYLINEIKALAQNKDYIILLKFHPLMDEHWLQQYKDLSEDVPNILFQEEKSIIKFLLIADILISDTSSVVYEFILLDKPVITFNNISKNILWENTKNYNSLIKLVDETIEKDTYANSRTYIKERFHPYNDGKSALRIVLATEKHIIKNGIPERRKLPFLRRLKINSIFK